MVVDPSYRNHGSDRISIFDSMGVAQHGPVAEAGLRCSMKAICCRSMGKESRE
jgi:hypothetical protein